MCPTCTGETKDVRGSVVCLNCRRRISAGEKQPEPVWSRTKIYTPKQVVEKVRVKRPVKIVRERRKGHTPETYLAVRKVLSYISVGHSVKSACEIAEIQPSLFYRACGLEKLNKVRKEVYANELVS